MIRPVYLLLLACCVYAILPEDYLNPALAYTPVRFKSSAQAFIEYICPTFHTTGPGAIIQREGGSGLPIGGSSYNLNPATATCGRPIPVCTKSRYRSIDGSCNNLIRPWWGKPLSPYGRLLPYNYGDGISSWPVAASGAPLPNPREISRRLFIDLPVFDQLWNLITQQWGQVIAHDMSFTAGVTQTTKDGPDCCDESGYLTWQGMSNSWCAAIEIPPDDPVHGPRGTRCMNFVRTASTKTRGCTPPNVPAEPLTAVTSYMDLSLVYGNTARQAAPLRSYRGGRLIVVRRKGHDWPTQDPKANITCEAAKSPREPCYLTGDARANQNPQLAIMHILLTREHNRIADKLARINPHWSDEVIFQEARRINIAQVQHISYHEYLPIILGYNNMVKNKLIYPNATDYVNDYNPKVDPSVLNEHATAAFRHFHTTIRGFLKLFTEARSLDGYVRISDWLNRPLIIELNDKFTQLARGLTSQLQHFSDQYWDNEMTQFLFKRNKQFGDDLRAIDIQRGRDHGLGTYVKARAICGLFVPKCFNDLLDFISLENVQLLRSIYETVQDVDLIVAGSLERRVPDTQAGPTFLCILTEQFYRTRVGDRFFYENGADKNIAFTPSQLQSIRRGSSIARLMCDNTHEIQLMQPRAFQRIRPGNQLVPCSQLPSINLKLWKDTKIN